MKNAPRIIPLEGFLRRAHFEYFAAMANPYMGGYGECGRGALPRLHTRR